MKTEKSLPTYTASIYVGGDLETAKAVCQDFCDVHGLCVTVDPTTYIYTRGRIEGVRVGLINYPRFPEPEAMIYGYARALVAILIHKLEQTSATIVTTTETVFLSKKGEDDL